MILITSMGGCASTSFIGWTSKRIECNCPLNSEGISQKGPGANPRGLKHRIKPPIQSDEYLNIQNSFNRSDINAGPIKRSIFLYDSPYNMVLSLFRRNIAMGHAMAVTGKRPPHANNLDQFLNQGVDSFQFNKQFENWTNKNTGCEYPRLLVKFESLWDNLDYLFGYMGIPESEIKHFIRKNTRVNRMSELSDEQKRKLYAIYSDLDTKMNNMNGIELI